MPIIIAENDQPKWLGEEPASEQELLALLKPCPDEALKIWPVEKMVGNVRNNGPQLILPVLSNPRVKREAIRDKGGDSSNACT